MANRDLLFKRINNALLDMQASTSQTFEQHFLTFARLLADSSLHSVNQRLVANLDVERFLDESSKTQGSMVGSARLVWPADADQVLGLKWLLVQKFACNPNQVLGFAHTYYSVGRNITGEFHILTRQLLIPFGRDYKEYVMTIDNPDGERSGTLESGGEAQRAIHQITYNISGNNARVNNHSTDNSHNIVSVNPDAVELLSALRGEISRMGLTSEQEREASELLDSAEAQIQSGKPSKPVLSALLKALPHAANVAAIVSSILSMF